MKIAGIIPSRYASTRFPGKPLINIGGKSMIQRVYEQALKSKSLAKVVVATDDARIFDHVKSFNGEVIMTSSFHESGTDRCAEVLSYLDASFSVAINIQGDEPFIHPEQIDALVACFIDEQTEIATLVKVIDAEEDLFNVNRPKVTLDKNSFATMFSRETIPNLAPSPKEEWLQQHTFYKHIGIYGYRTDVLQKINKLPPSALEIKERLEQLRWLENGYAIKVGITEHEGISIDTPKDLEKISF